MTNDIVERLRMQAEVADAFPMLKAKDSAMTNWVREAADEIERLRTKLRDAEQLRDHLRKALEVQIVMDFPTHTAMGASERADKELGVSDDR